jgi:hypothetical protein
MGYNTRRRFLDPGCGEVGSEMDVLLTYHLAMQILDVEGSFKGELVLNPKEVFLECGEPRRGRFHKMGSIQRGHGACVDHDGEEDF